jgi:hypothetical protein
MFRYRKVAKDKLMSLCVECERLKCKEYERTKVGVISTIYRSQKASSKKRKMPPPSYSYLFLKDFLIDDLLFNFLYNNWVNSGYETLLKPSIDRLDDLLPYTLNNIRLTTWGINKKKYNTDRTQGIDKQQNKAVVQFDTYGNKINEFFSASEANRKTGISRPDISVCCTKFVRKSGYYWRFKSEVKQSTKISIES